MSVQAFSKKAREVLTHPSLRLELLIWAVLIAILVGVRLYDLSTRTLFLFNVALVVLWLLIASFVVREHQRLRAAIHHATP